MTDKPMPKFIRRSLYALAVDDPQLGAKAYASWADAIILDPVREAGVDWREALRARMPAAIHAAASGGGEVLVRIDGACAPSELDATVFPGVTGVILRGAGSAEEIERACRCLATLEDSRGIRPGSLEIDVEVTTAAGVWHSLEIARASPRFGTFLIDEPALSASLGMDATPQAAFEPLEYVKSQLITVATSVGGQAQGMSHPLSLTGADPGADALAKAVRRARDTGFKGAVCPHVSWIAACNAGFRPSPDETAYYVKVREVFAEGLRRGMASVPIDGKMIDVPVDLRAKLYLEWAERARARDDAKAAAHAQPNGGR